MSSKSKALTGNAAGDKTGYFPPAEDKNKEEELPKGFPITEDKGVYGGNKTRPIIHSGGKGFSAR